jgi:XapX domain-containing protein
MKLYLVSLGAGLLVGVVYSLISVRSPAPPLVALIGLAGVLIGEQMLPIAKHMIGGSNLADAIEHTNCKSHILGALPSNTDPRDDR